MLLILDLATLLTCHKNTEQAKQKKNRDAMHVEASSVAISQIVLKCKNAFHSFCPAINHAQHNSASLRLSLFLFALSRRSSLWISVRTVAAPQAAAGRNYESGPHPLPNWVPAHTAFEIYTESKSCRCEGWLKSWQQFNKYRTCKITRVWLYCLYLIGNWIEVSSVFLLVFYGI